MDDELPPIGPTEQPRAPEPRPTDEVRRSRWRRPRFRDPRGIGRGITTAAVVVAAIAGAGALAVVAGALTLFGWGVAIVVAILAVGVVAAIHPRPANGWLLVPVLALALPAAAVAISGVRVLPERSRVVATPATVAEIPKKGYRAGFGDLLVDLRDLDVDGADQIVVRAGSDLGRTVVALPQDQCFNLDVRWQTGNLRLPRVRERPTVTGFRHARPLSRLGQQTPGNRKRWGTRPGRIALFGRAYPMEHGRWIAPAKREGAPTLTLELASEGGSFAVRTYPDEIAPLHATGWPIDQKAPPNEEYFGRDAPAFRMGGARRRSAGGVVGTIEGEGPYADHMRKNARRREAFALRWARLVTGTCNRAGTFR